MRDRLNRFNKLAKTQERLRQVKDAQLAALIHEDQKLSQTRARLVEALGPDAPCHGLFIDATARQLMRLDAEQRRLAAQIARAQAERAKARLGENAAERLADKIGQALLNDLERKRLEELSGAARSNPLSPR